MRKLKLHRAEHIPVRKFTILIAAILCVTIGVPQFCIVDSTSVFAAQAREVQPFTGLVLWQENEAIAEMPVQLEFAYVGYDEVTQPNGSIDFIVIEKRLNEAAQRGHQMILRFYDTYPGQKSHVPSYIINQKDYNGTAALSEGMLTGFPDWSNKAYQNHVLSILTAFAKKYDKDPRVAYLQVGFGLWSEYHIYDGPLKLGRTFPTKDFQKSFLTHMDSAFRNLKWSISIDSASSAIGPFEVYPQLLKKNFGVFDDSFMSEEHDSVNRLNHIALGLERYKTAPVGGEISYYTEEDQRLALSVKGVHNRTFLSQAERYHISYMIANDQPEYQDFNVLKQNSAGLGYRFKLLDTKYVRLKNVNNQLVLYTRITVKNTGTAPIYYPAYLQIGQNKSSISLEKLLPGMVGIYDILGRNDINKPIVISCERLLPNQKIALEDSR